MSFSGIASAAAALRVRERAEPAAADFFFRANAEAEKWPQLTPMEVLSVLATEKDPAKVQDQLQRLACHAASGNASVHVPSRGRVQDRLDMRKRDPLHRVESGRVEHPRVEQRGAQRGLPEWRAPLSKRLYTLVGDSHMVRLAEALGYTRDHSSGKAATCGPLCVSGAVLPTVVRAQKETRPPKHALVLVGTNDVMQGRNTSDDLEHLVTFLARRCQSAAILVLPPCRRYEAGHKVHGDIAKFNANLQDVARRHGNVRAVDVFTGQDLSGFYQKFKSDGRPDMVHLTREGYKKTIQLLSAHL